MVDRWVGMLLRQVEDLGLLEDTAIVFTSDHGFYLGEHGLIGKSVIAPIASGSCPLYEEIAHIPLIIYLPDVNGGKHCQTLAQPPDLTATILELMGGRNLDSTQGRSLLPLLEEEDAAWRDFAVTSPSIIHGPVSGQRITVTSRDWALIYTGQIDEALGDRPGPRRNFKRLEALAGEVKNELYNLSKDPKQHSNVFEKERDVAERLHLKLVELLEKSRTREEYLRYWRRLG